MQDQYPQSQFEQPLTQTPTPPISPTPQLTPEQPKKNKIGLIVAIILVVVLAAAGCTAAFLLNRNSAEEAPASNTSDNNSTPEQEPSEEDLITSIKNKIKNGYILVTVGGKSFSINGSFENNIRNAAENNTLYELTETYDYAKIDNIDSFLQRSLTIDPEGNDISASILTKDRFGRTLPTATISGHKYLSSEQSVKYTNLDSSISIDYIPNAIFYLDDVKLQFDKTTPDDLVSIYGSIKEDTMMSSVYLLKYHGYMITFDFDSVDDELNGVRIMRLNSTD